MAVPDVVVEVVPILALRHRESHFPRHGSDPAAGQVGLPGFGEGHSWKHRDKESESARPAELLKSHVSLGHGHKTLPSLRTPEKQNIQP